MKRFLIPLFSLFLLPSGSEAVWCRQCFNYNGQVCVNAADCQGNYCLIEEVTQWNGVKATKKTCLAQPYYQYPDGSYLSTTNYCSSRTVNGCQYQVKICDSSNYCNDFCTGGLPMPPPTLGPPPTIPVAPTTFAPILPGMVECFNCETFDGTDCRDNTCQGKYCLYLRQITGNSMRVKKSCVNEALVILDDGTEVQTLDFCEIRNTASSQYYVKVCKDQDYCNGYCNTDVVTDTPPQRQPMITCYSCESRSGECFTGQCQAAYCLYEYQYSRSTRSTYSRKGCSQLPYVEFPDNTISRDINTCEYKTINDIDYQVRVCNNGNNCNSACPTVPPVQNSVTCTMCESTTGTDCTSPATCSGQYCIYAYQKNQQNGGSIVKKSCSNSPDFVYPDGSIYRNYNSCEFKTLGGVQYTLKMCNSSSFCSSTLCGGTLTTTSLPVRSASFFGAGLTLILTFLLI